MRLSLALVLVGRRACRLAAAAGRRWLDGARKYLVNIAGCNDCHTPAISSASPIWRVSCGSEVGFEIPGLGIFHGPNLTPDKETGLGNWTTRRSRPR